MGAPQHMPGQEGGELSNPNLLRSPRHARVSAAA
jgi:hypothetical protein